MYSLDPNSGAITQIGYQFSGHYRHVIDAKGRVSIPARLRQQVRERAESSGRQEAYALLRGPDGVLLLMPEESWERLNEAMFSRSPNDPENRYLRRKVQYESFPVTPDKQGRIAIPSTLAADAGLSREALFLGYGPYVEIWDPDRYGQYLRDREGTYSWEDIWQQMYEVLVPQPQDTAADGREDGNASAGDGPGGNDPADPPRGGTLG